MDIFSEEKDRQKPINFTIMHTNDEHSSFLPHRPSDESLSPESAVKIGGFARLASLVKKIREENPGEKKLLVSAGDFLSGDPFSWLSFSGESPELDLMKDLGYDVLTLGNHDLDYGPGHLDEYLDSAGFPASDTELDIIASNTDIPEDGPLSRRGISDFSVQGLEDDFRVGFFGILGDQAIDLIKNRENLEFEHPLVTAEAAVRELKQREADVIIALSHAGLKEDQELVKHVDDIDIIIGGHSHTILTGPVKTEDTIIVQTGCRFENLGVLRLCYRPAAEEVVLRDGEKNLLAVDEEVDPDPAMAEKVSHYTDRLSEYVSRIYHRRLDLNWSAFAANFSVPHLPDLAETPCGNFFTDALRFSAAEMLEKEVDFAFQASGLIRQGLYPEEVDDGKEGVTYYQLASIGGMGSGWNERPGYPLLAGYLTGKEIRRVLELSILISQYMGSPFYLQVSGLRFTYDRRKAILGNIPVLNKPLPTGRAVKSIQKYTGGGVQTRPTVQNSDQFQDIAADDDTEYLVALDYYLASFIPYVCEKIPFLEIELKDEGGEPYQDLSRAVVENKAGEEMKIWEAVFNYSRQQRGSLDPVYKDESGRAENIRELSLLATPAFSALSVFLTLLIVIILVLHIL
ncbi:bifunctional metallophosphatase/5'-nucleotidase [Halarsenatibacter silvermanii]|uniref:UDP-sugar diphosphatase n=1 Tax=Halarsenatibacter silvermanii TaxID=321763 RepID=A0A1G9SIR5_9FIRM|nr:bifunctional UDP-sugar hydrolase/5'-nucleotidase [Halarsenatibacter silvermanii]SDM35398.1 UDP-sugar diphosphatase [Halarsenatibacter silvermanii]